MRVGRDILEGKIRDGQTVRVSWDGPQRTLTFTPVGEAAK
jgi:hypothetical protein